MVQQGFFSGSASKSQRIANAGPSTPIRIDSVTTREGKTFNRVLPNMGAGRVGEIRVKKAEAKKEDKPFFSQRLNDVKIASNQVQPLSEIGSSTYEKEVKGYIEQQLSDPYRSLNYDTEGYRLNKFRDRVEESPSFGEDVMRENYPAVRQFLYDRNPLKYVPGEPLSKKKEDEGNILTKTGNFIANLFTPPAVAGTLEGKPTRFAGEADPTPRPKLDYVNPDKTTMTGSEIRDAFKPSNLFGYKDKFGRFGEAVDRDRQQTMNQVAQRYSSMPDQSR